MTAPIVLDLKKNAGITLNLKKLVPSLVQLSFQVGWQPHPVHKDSMKDGFDLDLTVYALNSSGKIDKAEDVVFFNNKRYTNDSIILPKDNRDGQAGPEELFVDLTKVPADRTQLDLYVFIFDYLARQQNFGMISNAKASLIDGVTGKVIQEYALNESFSQDSAVHVGSLVRSDDGWVFNPVGIGAKADPQDVVGSYC
jgi:stress response protein SCP2